jgi:hypothetical protein
MYAWRTGASAQSGLLIDSQIMRLLEILGGSS